MIVEALILLIFVILFALALYWSASAYGRVGRLEAIEESRELHRMKEAFWSVPDPESEEEEPTYLQCDSCQEWQHPSRNWEISIDLPNPDGTYVLPLRVNVCEQCMHLLQPEANLAQA